MPRMRFPEVVKASSAVVSGVVGSFFQESRQIFSLYFSFSMSRSRSRSYKSMSRMKFKFPEVVRILSGAFFEDKSFPQDKRQGILWLRHHLQMNSSGTSLPYFISSSSPLLKNKQNSLKLTKETSIIQWNNYSCCSSLCSCENPFFEHPSQARCF